MLRRWSVIIVWGNRRAPGPSILIPFILRRSAYRFARKVKDTTNHITVMREWPRRGDRTTVVVGPIEIVMPPGWDPVAAGRQVVEALRRWQEPPGDEPTP